jgi:copper chaperone
MTTISLEVQGMSCGGCVKRVTDALEPVHGVNSVKVDLAANQVTVNGDFRQGSDPLVLALTAAGYPAKLSTSVATTPVANKSGGCCG